MALAETANLVVSLTLKDQLSQGVQKAEGQLGKLNTQAVASGTRMTALGGASAKASQAMVGFGGAIGHASSKIGGLLTGPLGLIGLTGGILGFAGALESSVHKIEDFGLGLEKVQTLTGETAQQSGALILLFEKYGLGVDRVTQIAGFAEKTLGKLNETTAKGTKATKSAELQNLELVKAQRQAAGESTKAINKLISEQKARDQLTAMQAKAAGSLTKLQALDKQYGLQLVDSKGKVVDFSTELSQLADLYDRNIPASTKAYVAAQVLGKGYAASIPILKGGAAALRAASEEAKQLGLDQAGTAEKLAKFRDSMRELGAQVNVLQLQIGMALVPALTDAAKAVSSWLASGGDQQILDFFKGAASFAQQFGHAVETFVVPAFKAISSAWGAIPGPLKDLLIGGFIANKAGKFLFDKSLFGGVKSLIGSLLGKVPVVGGALEQATGTGGTPVFVTNWPAGFGGGLPNVIPLGPGVAAAGGVASVGALAGVAAAALAASPIAIAAIKEITHKATDPVVAGGSRGFFPGVHARDLIPGTNLMYDPRFSGGSPADHARAEREDRNADDVKKALADLRVSERESWTGGAAANAVAAGIIHSGVFGKAQQIRETGGFNLSIDVLRAAVHGVPSKVGAQGVETSAEAVALAAINHLRMDPSQQSLKSAAYDLRLIKADQKHLPADMAAKLAPKIHSLEAAINAANRDITNAINTKQFTVPPLGVLLPGDTRSEGRAAGGGKANTPRRVSVAGTQSQREHAAGFLGLTTGMSDLGIAGEAGQEAVAIIRNPKGIKAPSHAAAAARVFVTNWPKSGDQTSASSKTTAQATTALAKDTTTRTHRQQVQAALKAIKERAIAAGHTGAPQKVHATYERDIKRGDTLPFIIKVQSSIKDTNTAQDKRARWGKTPTQVGAQ